MAMGFGYLRSLKDLNADLIPILNKVTTLGRSSKCDIKVRNKYVSCNHCRLEMNENDEFWLYDTSSNGILVEGKKVIHHEKIKLECGDAFHLVHEAPEPHLNVGYQLQKNSDHECKSLSIPEESRSTVERINDTQKQPSKETPQSSDGDDTMGELLMCVICQEIFRNCISLLPCMHNFCDACYTEGSHKNDCCPSCGGVVEETNAKHLVNDTVEAYLTKYPEKKRSAKELKELHLKSKMKGNGQNNNWKNTGIENACDDYDDSDDEVYDHDFDGEVHLSVWSCKSKRKRRNDGVDDDGDESCKKIRRGTSTCRQCQPRPGSSNQPGTSVQVDFVCSQNQDHILCMCCHQPMPIHVQDNVFPPQKCGVCLNAYCHMYWGCRKPSCFGCLGLFKDITFPESMMNTILLENSFESNILKSYLKKRKTSAEQFFKTIVDQCYQGILQCSDKDSILSNKPLCRSCATKNLMELAFKYRTNLTLHKLRGLLKAAARQNETREQARLRAAARRAAETPEQTKYRRERNRLRAAARRAAEIPKQAEYRREKNRLRTAASREQARLGAAARQAAEQADEGT